MSKLVLALRRWAQVLRPHATTVMLVAASAGAAGYLYATRESVTTGEKLERRSNLFRVFRRDTLTRITVERDGERYELVRDAERKDAGEIDTWKLYRGGRPETADESLVDGLLQALELAFPDRRIAPAEVDRRAFGLDAPRLVVTLSMGAQASTLRVGGPSPKPEGAVYADVDGEGVVLKRDRLLAVDRPAAAYASRRLSPFLSSELARLTLSGGTDDGARERVLVRQKDGKFRLDGRLVDRFGFDKALSAFADLTLTANLSEAVVKTAQEGMALVRVRLDPAPKQGEARGPVTLFLGGPCPAEGHEEDVAARRDGPETTAGCVARAAAEALGKGVEAELRAFTFREDEVEEVSVSRGSVKLEIARKEKGFHQRLPEDRDLSLDEARAFVKLLVSARAESFTPDDHDPPELVSPVGEVRVSSVPLPDAEPGGERIFVGSPRPDGKVPVKREVDGAVLIFSREVAAAFLPRATSLRPHRILDRKPEDVRRIVAVGETEGGTLDQVLVRDAAGSWSLEKPSGLPLDLGVATDMAEALARLTADRWVADLDDGSGGFDKPVLTVTVTFAGAPETNTHRLVFGHPSSGGTLARRDGDPAVFLAGKALRSTLATLALDRQAFQIDETDAARVSLRRGSTVWAFAYEGGALVPKEGNASPRDGERVREALAGLRAEAALHVGPPARAEGFTSPQLVVSVQGKPGKPDVRFQIGAADTFRGTAIFYARKDGVPATFALPSARVRPLLEDR